MAHEQTASEQKDALTGEGHAAGATPEQSAVTDVTKPDSPADRTALATRGPRWAWARHWEFWLALGLGAFLRLWHIDVTQFLDDQARLMLLARSGVLHGALPITGIPSSIGTLNPPLSVYLLMPFAALSKNPMPIVVSIALWNIVGVALAYVFALRYFGRVVAATGALLFATCGAAVNYSRFIWQQNYLPPLLVLWALTLYAGAVRGKRGWFVPNVVLLVVAVLLHPTVVLLAPVTLAGLLLAPRAPRLWEYAVAGLLALALVAPSLLWEGVSNGSDLSVFAQYFAQTKHLDAQVLRMLYAALGGPGSNVGSPAVAATLNGVYTAVNIGAALLVAAGCVVLTWRVLAPVIRGWVAEASPRSGLLALVGRLGALWRELRGDAAWRASVLLWLWVAVPLAAMLRHAGQIYIHYLMVLYPAIFLVAGIAVHWLVARRDNLARVGGGRVFSAVSGALPVVSLALVAALVAGQMLQATLSIATLAAGRFDAYNFYGYPLGDLLAADSRLAALQAQQGAASLFLIAPTDIRYRAPLDYQLVSEHADRSAVSGNCLMLPGPNEGPALIASSVSGTPADALLAALPGASQVADLALRGSSPWPVYRVAGPPPLLRGETAVVPAEFRDAAGNGLRLDAVAVDGPGLLRLRWTVIGPGGGAGTAPWYRVGASSGPASTRVDCRPTSWRAGATLFTWMVLPPAGSAAAPAALALSVSVATTAPDLRTVGPLRLLSARTNVSPFDALPPVLAGITPPGAAPGTVTASGYVLPADVFSHG